LKSVRFLGGSCGEGIPWLRLAIITVRSDMMGITLTKKKQTLKKEEAWRKEA